MRPLAIDLYAGLGGWAEGFLAEGWDCIGFDIERHVYGEHKYPGMLVIQDVLTLHGSQFEDADCIVCSPPCQEPSYRAMPWSRAKALNAAGPPEQFIKVFDACFRIQREAIEAAGRHIPLVVENVRGAQPWVGRARWNCGSMYLWGDVPALMPPYRHIKVGGIDWSKGDSFNGTAEAAVRRTAPGSGTRFTSRDCGIERQAWFNDRPRTPTSLASSSSRSRVRKEAAALIEKIPLPLSRHIARTFHPRHLNGDAQDTLGFF